jgi:aspartate/methionine/tyrosine aminotransferase
VQGDSGLRKAISNLYAHLDGEEILVHSGAEEAIFNFMNVKLGPGDHVVVHSPCYQSLSEVARSIGAEVSPWLGDPGSGWVLDLEDLKSLLTDRTRIVVVNFPHNPNGFLPTLDFVRELSSLSEHHGFTIFSDEVYQGLELDPDDRLPALADLNDKAVSLGVMSKTYGLAGLRIGWIASRDRQLLDELARFKDYTTICNSAPSEFLAALALRNAAVIVERNLGIIRENLDRLDGFFESRRDLVRWTRPKAGSIAFPALLSGDIEEFCTDVLTSVGVLLLPGTLYGDSSNSFRVGFGRRNLPEALKRLEEYFRGRQRR